MPLVLTVSSRPLNSTRTERDDLGDQIYRQIKVAIVDGRLRPGETLPTIARLRRELGVAPSTIMAAYRSLAEDGLTEGRRAFGTVVKARTDRAVDDLAEERLVESLVSLCRELGVSQDRLPALCASALEHFAAGPSEENGANVRVAASGNSQA